MCVCAGVGVFVVYVCCVCVCCVYVLCVRVVCVCAVACVSVLTLFTCSDRWCVQQRDCVRKSALAQFSLMAATLCTMSCLRVCVSAWQVSLIVYGMLNLGVPELETQKFIEKMCQLTELRPSFKDTLLALTKASMQNRLVHGVYFQPPHACESEWNLLGMCESS